MSEALLLLNLARTTCATASTVDASTASDLAWAHRWDPWPTSARELHDAAVSFAAAPQELRFAYWCAARRLHYAFAHRVLIRFADEAIALDGPDDFLELLGHAGRAATEGDSHSWDSLVAAQAGRSMPADKALHIFLTSVYTALEVPEDTLRLALEMAEAAAKSGDAVAAYRVVSLLRRAGRPVDGFAALEDACALLASGTVTPSLAEHLSERLVTERVLLAEAYHQSA